MTMRNPRNMRFASPGSTLSRPSDGYSVHANRAAPAAQKGILPPEADKQLRVEQAGGCRTNRQREPEMLERGCGRHSPARCPADKSELHQVWLIHVLDGVGLLADRDRQRRESDRPPSKFSDQSLKNGTVDAIETLCVHGKQLQT